MITLNRKVRFTHSDFTYTGTTYTEYLFGSVGLKVNADIVFDIHWSTLATNMRFTAADNSVERLDGASTFLDDGFKDGDTVVFTDTVSNNLSFTCSSISSDGTIMYMTGGVTDETIVCNAYGNTIVTSVDFYPNLIPNNTDFNLFNLTDRETIPRYSADTISSDSANPTVMQITSNSHGWVTPADQCTIYVYPSIFSPYTQRMVISHTFNIAPIFLANQLQTLKNIMAGRPPEPSAYKDRDCLKYVYTIDAKYSKYDPTIPHTSDGNVVFPQGQTGGFNEFINGRPTVWTKESIAYSDNATGAGLSRIDYCKVNDVEAHLVCQVAAGSTYIVQVLYLPQNEDEYVNTATDFKTNFIYERAVVTIGGGTVQGENTGDYHFLKNVVATAITTYRTKVTFQIDFGSVLTELFDTKDSDNLNYLIFITAQNNAIAVP